MPNDHELTIIINSRPTQVLKGELSFQEVLGLAFDPVPSGEMVEFTVAYRRGGGKKHEGTMVEGESVKVKDGMVFDVTETDKS